MSRALSLDFDKMMEDIDSSLEMYGQPDPSTVAPELNSVQSKTVVEVGSIAVSNVSKDWRAKHEERMSAPKPIILAHYQSPFK